MEVMQFMWAQEVIVCDPQGKVIAGTIIVVEAVRRAVRGLVGPVKPLDHLLIRAEFFGDCIFVRQTDDLRDIKLKVFSELMEELLGGKRIGTVTVGGKTEAVGKLFQVLEGHAHSHDAGTDAAVVRDLIADHGAGGGIDDEPDIAFDAPDLDVGLIGSKDRPFFVGIGINKGFDADCGSLTVVRDHLVGYGDAVDVFQGPGSLTERQPEIDPVGKAQGHDIGVVPAELQRRCVLRQGGDIHPEEIYRELAVDIVQLILVLAVVFFQICLINLFQVVEIIGAFGVHAFMDDEVLTVFPAGQRMGTVGALEREDPGRTVLVRRKPSAADLAQELPGFTVISVQVGLGSLTEGAGTVFRDITFGAAPDRELIHLELLVPGRMGIIKGPLFKRDISADKVDQPAILLIKLVAELKKIQYNPIFDS